MEFFVSGSGFGLRAIHPLVAQVIRDIPKWADCPSQTIDARIFPAPVKSDDESGFMDDWKAYVQPGLQELFQSARSVVAEDLKSLTTTGDAFSLEVPASHADAWINALNQARLALSAQNDFSENDLSSENMGPPVDQRAYDLMRIHLYGFLQQCIVEFVAGGDI